MMPDRGQSETLGFILVFALITTSTGVVYVAGFSTLEDARRAEQLDNMERAFELLDGNVRALADDDVPGRSTEVKLAGGDMRIGDPTNVTVRGTYVSNGSSAGDVSISSRPVVYRLDATEVVYSSGAIVRSERDSAVMLSEPRWVVDERRAVLSLLNVDAASSRTSIGGETTVQVLTTRESRSMSSFATGPGRVNLTVTVESEYAGAWTAFFEDRGFQADDADPSDGEVTYFREFEEVHVPVVGISVEFDQ